MTAPTPTVPPLPERVFTVYECDCLDYGEWTDNVCSGRSIHCSECGFEPEDPARPRRCLSCGRFATVHTNWCFECESEATPLDAVACREHEGDVYEEYWVPVKDWASHWQDHYEPEEHQP